MPGEATVPRTGGCPAIDGSQGKAFRPSRPGHSAVRFASGFFPGMDNRPLVRTRR
ncbi:MAG: hypothetical protein J5654_13035 [Victivallales bacterium]|nr:hypothetical protein [Victivallales bacterium]